MDTVMKIDTFEVTRIHGMNAFYSLRSAYDVWKEYRTLKKQSDKETWKEKYQTADSTGIRVQGLGTTLFSNLSQTVVLYQASMEAIISNAASMDESIRAVAVGNGFKKDWIAALKAVNETCIEFSKYERDFYKQMRIPLTHLHPQTEEKLQKLRLIDFEGVYCGLRFGWWAHIRLLRGIGLSSDDIHSNWSDICSGVNLPPDLFPDRHPDILGNQGEN